MSEPSEPPDYYRLLNLIHPLVVSGSVRFSRSLVPVRFPEHHHDDQNFPTSLLLMHHLPPPLPIPEPPTLNSWTASLNRLTEHRPSIKTTHRHERRVKSELLDEKTKVEGIKNVSFSSVTS